MEWDRCPICNKQAPEDYEPPMCCSGHECGCMGLPIEPYVCSKECHNKLMLGVFEPNLDIFKEKPPKEPCKNCNECKKTVYLEDAWEES